MHYTYLWQPQGVTAPQLAKMPIGLDMRWVSDTDTFRRNWSQLQTTMHAGDTLTVNGFDALGPSIIGARNILNRLLHRGISVNISDMGMIKVTAAGKIVSGTSILRIIDALAAAQTRMTLAEQQYTPTAKRRGRPFKLEPAARLAVIDYCTTHTQNETAAHFHISRATVARIIRAHTQRFKH
ncbi:recombinase family protein [Lacticaseibacillus sharpeae]|uniref:Resolvase n=2 Tax=Lacticaseibacillus sharpeae TaxID=1626 RepID=A0A0R1ZQ47_9LACO|nr:recombinase family protein [Lacticaseibacillus sharpeae]KRM56498.1 hypothetical protein FC18_GL001974 [Lacticaseibacillus sharpeae JCM 1186 = DSM 20505]